MDKRTQIYFLAFFFILIIGTTSFVALNFIMNTTQNNSSSPNRSYPTHVGSYTLQFNGTRAFTYLKDQVDIGFRPPNSTGIIKERALIVHQLLKFNWTVIFNNFTYRGVQSANILAFPGNGRRTNFTLFGAHFDTRWLADAPDSTNKSAPVLGANDGASGVGVLMELAQIFANRTDVGLLFIDAEDQGGINGWEYLAGTYEFVNSTVLQQYFPQGKSDIRIFVLLDMVGDWNLNIYRELNSNVTFVNQIWSAASFLGYSSYFINEPGYNMIDDHIPFLKKGIPAVDIIDYDYVDQNGWNLHHTTNDTLKYVSANSLWIVGRTIEFWLKRTSDLPSL